MSDYGMLMQKLLVVELLRKHFLFRCGSDYCALVGKNKLFRSYKLPCLCEKPCFFHPFEIKKQNSCVYVVGGNKEFAVMVSCGGILVAIYIYIVKEMNVSVEQYINVEIKELIGHTLDLVSKKADKGIGRAICALVRTSRELAVIYVCYVYLYCSVLGIILLYNALKKLYLSVVYGQIGILYVGYVHCIYVKGKGLV